MPDHRPRRSRDEAISAYRDALLRDAPPAELAQIAAALDPETVQVLDLFRAAQRQAEAAPQAFVARLERVLASAPGPEQTTASQTRPLRANRSRAVNGRIDESILTGPLPALPPTDAAPQAMAPRPRQRPRLFAAATCVLIALLIGLAAVRQLQPQQEQLVAPPFVAHLQSLWTSTGGPDPLVHPYGVAVDPQGNIWVADGQHDRFQILAPDGTYRETWGESGVEDGQFNFHSESGNPMYDYGDVAFAPDGTFFVVDTGNHRIQQFAPDRSFVRAWGSVGNQPGQFVTPVGIAVGPDGVVYVSDEHRGDIQKFSPEGTLLGTIGRYGQEPGQLRAPGGLAIDAVGDIWVADSLNNRVQRFSPDGSLDAIVGRQGTGEGEFERPNDVAIDANGRLYVADMGNHEVQVFGRDGQFLATTGRRDSPLAPFSYPLGIAAAEDRTIYVVDSQRVRALQLVAAFNDQ